MARCGRFTSGKSPSGSLMAATKVPHKQLDVYYDNMDPAQTDSSGLQWELMFIWCPINNPINPLAAKLFNLNFRPLEFVSR